MLTGLVTTILPQGTFVQHRLFGRGKVLPRTALLPDYLTLVAFPEQLRDGSVVRVRRAIFTDYLKP